MTGRLRSSKASEFEVGEIFEKVIKGLRHEMSGVIENIKRSRNLSVEYGIRWKEWGMEEERSS
jgi:hypothetical protein